MVDNKDKAGVRAPPALNPEQLALTQPWKDFVSLGLIQAITAKFTPGGTQVSVDISDSIPDAKIRTGLAPGVAKQIIIASGLAPQKGNKNGNGKKKEEPLPARSLCAKDVEKAANFVRRLKDVSNKIGPSTALGRIGSLKMHIDGVVTFEEWWAKAGSSERIALVTDKKHIDALDESESQKLKELIANVSESPFRGPFPDNSLDNEKKEEVKKTAPKPTAAAPSKGKQPVGKK